MFESTIKLGSFKIGIGVILVLSLFTVNPIATFLAVLFIPFAAKLLWRKNEPPILFFALLMQWLQICVKILYADFIFKDFAELFQNYRHIDQAYYYSLLSLYTIAAGIFIVIRTIPTVNFEQLKIELSNYNQKKIVLLYIAAIFLTPLLLGVSRVIPGAQQVFVKVLDIKWAIYFLFFASYFMFDKNKRLFYIFFVGEVVASFTGYFSSFKEFFLVVIIFYIFIKKSYTLFNYIAIAAIMALLFNLMVIWQYVKPAYRAYLSGGERAQTITVSKSSALEKLFDLVQDAKNLKYEDGVTAVLDRLSYIEIFSGTIDFVPLNLPHEHGRLWADAVKRVVMPRILFPDKLVIDDSEKTNKYSGMAFAGASSGTSVSLGYVTESYIDFGFPGMLVPLLGWGLLIGFIYKHIYTKSYNIIWGLAFLVPLLFQINTFETALDKLIGSFIAFFLIYIFLNKFVVKRLDNYLRN